MQDAVPVGKGSMIAVLNLSIDVIENYIKNIKNECVCEIANDNAVGQTIVSGSVESINILQQALTEE